MLEIREYHAFDQIEKPLYKVSRLSKMAEATDDEWAREFTFEAEKFQ